MCEVITYLRKIMQIVSPIQKKLRGSLLDLLPSPPSPYKYGWLVNTKVYVLANQLIIWVRQNRSNRSNLSTFEPIMQSKNPSGF